MSHAAFLASIRAAPADDLPRLVYADWLDEHGDQTRAEFIRVQCELAGLSEIDPRRPGLEDREHALLAAGEAAWCGFPAGAVTEWEFRRGFVDQAWVGVGHLADPMAVTALTRHPVSRLDLHLDLPPDAAGRPADYHLPGVVGHPVLDGVAALDARTYLDHRWFVPGSLPRLRSLTCSQLGWRDILELLRRADQTHRLTVLYLPESGYDEHTPDIPDLLDALGPARLERLGLPDSNLTSSDLAALLASPKLSSLTSLDVSRNPLDPYAWHAFRDADPALRLNRLDVSFTELGLDAATFEPLLNTPALDRLTDLDLVDCEHTHRFGEAVAASPYWTQAKSLRIRSMTDTPQWMEPLGRVDGPPALRLLDLNGNGLGADGVRLLCSAPWAGSLTWLALSRNDLGDDAVRTLARCGRFIDLRTLHLGYNRASPENSVTDAGSLELARAPGLARLRILTLEATRITDAAVGPLINGDHWNLSGLGLGGCDLSAAAARALAASPRLARLEYLNLSSNPWLGDRVLDVLADSPYLSPLCELNVRGVNLADRTRAALRDRLGPRLSE